MSQCFSSFQFAMGQQVTFDAGCPSMAEANADHGFDGGDGCGVFLSDATVQDGLCCYEVAQCYGGRPYVERGERRSSRARPTDRAPWVAQVGSPWLEGLSSELRARLAAAWLSDGLLEHASIASFGRFAMELLAIGAPAEFVTSVDVTGTAQGQ